MATLTITVPDTIVPRLRAAFGRENPATGGRIPATNEEIQATLKSWVKGITLEYETAQAANIKRAAVGAEDWDK